MLGLKRYPQPRKWRTPGGEYCPLYAELLDEEHILIAGTTGSGKSVLLNSILQTALVLHSPAEMRLHLIDCKRVELVDYARLPHCAGYIDKATDACAFLRGVLRQINARYEAMRAQGAKKWSGAVDLIVIDELLPLMLHDKRTVKVLAEIAFVGRAAGYKVIACTQKPSRDVIPAMLSANFVCRVGLRCVDKIESRQAVGANGCETLPEYGEFLLRTRKPGIQHYRFGMIDEARTAELIRYWTSPACRA